MHAKGDAAHSREQKGSTIGVDPEPVAVGERGPHLPRKDLGQESFGVGGQIHARAPAPKPAVPSATLDLVKGNPPALARRAFKGIDRPLHDGTLGEVTLVVVTAANDLVGKITGQIGVEEQGPRLPAGAAGRKILRRDLLLDKLYGVLPRRLQRLADAKLLDQAHDEGTFRPVQPGLYPRVVADRDIRRLDRGHDVG